MSSVLLTEASGGVNTFAPGWNTVEVLTWLTGRLSQLMWDAGTLAGGGVTAGQEEGEE